MIKARKRLGQHFLRDPNTARKIIGALDAPSSATVVEIGPGTGALTTLLAARHPGLIAVDIDERAVSYLQDKLPGVDIRQVDILDFDWSELNRGDHEVFVIGNLPYNITTPILFSMLESRCVHKAVVMMQLEVAERIVAHPRTKAYGILSVLFQLFAEPRLLFRVPPTVFAPKPAVMSAVVGLDFAKKASHSEEIYEAVRKTVRLAFNQRRKTLRNSIRKLIDECGIRPQDELLSKRAEELNPSQFVELTRMLFGIV